MPRATKYDVTSVFQAFLRAILFLNLSD